MRRNTMKNYISATPSSGKTFYQEFHGKGKIVMLNLLKFRKQADYTNFEQLQPKNQLTGEQAYQLYMQNTSHELEKVGSKILYFGKCHSFLIGPESENWDAMLLVEHQSVVTFMEFAQNKEYLKNAGHRTAALEDSRLLPSTKIIESFSI